MTSAPSLLWRVIRVKNISMENRFLEAREKMLRRWDKEADAELGIERDENGEIR